MCVLSHCSRPILSSWKLESISDIYVFRVYKINIFIYIIRRIQYKWWINVNRLGISIRCAILYVYLIMSMTVLSNTICAILYVFLFHIYAGVYKYVCVYNVCIYMCVYVYVCVGVYVQIHICIFKKKGRERGGGGNSVSTHHPELIEIPGGPLV